MDLSETEYDHTIAKTKTMYTSIARDAMQKVWNHSPNPFQTKIIPIILQMMSGDKVPRPLFLVQTTGSGKLSVHV